MLAWWCRAGEATQYDQLEPAPPTSQYQYQYVPNQTFMQYPQLANDQPMVWDYIALNNLTYNNNSALVGCILARVGLSP